MDSSVKLIKVQRRFKYGRWLNYPVNGFARQCAELVGRKTFLDADLEKLQALGYTLEWVPTAVGEIEEP